MKPTHLGHPARVIALWIPEWSMHATRTTLGIPTGTRLALIEKGRVRACSATACADGVTPGLKVREAQLRSPELVLETYDPQLVARAFDPYLRALEQGVPFIQVIRPGLVAVRAGGLARFHGSEHAAGKVLREILRDAGANDVRAAAADGLFCAEQVVRTTTLDHPWRVIAPGGSPGFLAPLPISALTDALGDERTTTLLTRMGIRTIGAFGQLPRAQVHSRFGAPGLFAHRLASGMDAPSLQPSPTAPDLSQRVVIDPPSVRTETVLSTAEPASAEFIAELGRQSLACQEMRLTIVFESGAVDERVWRHPWPLTAEDVHERLRWQLEELVVGTSDDGRDGDELVADAMVRVTMDPVRTAPAAHHAQGLWGERPDNHVVHTITRLQRRLGHSGVLVASLGGGRLLHERVRFYPWGDSVADDDARRRILPWPGRLPGIPPATVYPHARTAAVTSQQDEPVRVDIRGKVSDPPRWMTPPGEGRAPITSWAGPWPVNQRWWQRNSSRLNRFQVVTGSRAWVLLCDGSRWWAEGHYA